MKKNISIRKKQNSRGVAVIFTLGILGLLTVMALGFASTALLNRKIADNTSSADYSRHIAKNIAFARAKNAVMRNEVVSSFYSSCLSSYSDGNGKTRQDFLYKMDTVLDGVELYRVTNDSGAIQSNTARWQYVTVPNDNNRILGRYAFAVIPDIGRMDPNVHLGTSADASNRYGYSMQELSLPAGTAESTDWKTSLTGKLTDPDRWRSFSELFRCLGKDMAAPSADVRNILSDGISLRNSQSPETFWLDLNNDGKRTPEEMFLRFNLTRDWNSTTVDNLIGASSATDLTLDDPGSAKSIGFIPWLKNWDYVPSGTTDWTADLIKKQIAANIIQYNRSADQPTVTDKPDADDASWTWLTDTPSYAGVGRHPMLNEIAFLFRVKAHVTTSNITVDDEHGTITCTYTPTYYITFDAGAELIYPFGSASNLKESTIRFPDMEMQFKLRKFLRSGKSPDPQTTVNNLGNQLIQNDILNSQMLHSDLDRINIKIPGKSDGAITYQKLIDSSTVVEPMSNTDSENYAWTNLNFSSTTNSALEASDWNTSPAYTKASSFWKGDKTGKQQTLKMQIRTITITTSKSLFGDNADEHVKKIAEAMARRMTIEWETLYKTPDTVVLKYDGKQRDVAKLATKTLPPTMTDMSPEKVWFVVYEAKDPLVNHYSSDWAVKQEGPKELDESRLTTNGYYPGTLYDGSADKHVNSTLSGSLPLSLTVNGTTIQEAAADPAYTTATRLSSSYIRHGQMKSLWELSFISRAEAFRTLNLAKVRTFAAGTAAADRKANTFGDGDANILDQVKLSESTDAASDLLYPYGKINLNSTSHRVFEQVFNANVKWFESLRAFDTETTDHSPFGTTGTTSTAACSDSNCRKMIPCADPASCPHKYVSTESPGCLAHLLLDRSSILPFSNRSDLLVEPTDAELAKLPGYSALSSTQQTKLAAAQGNLRDWLLRNVESSPLCKTEKEQYAARFMNLFCTEPVQHVYIVVLAQSIKDIGGASAFVDWDGNGEYTPASGTAPSYQTEAKFLKTGFVRKQLYGSGYQTITPSSGSAPSLVETLTSTTVGTYDFGADKITGETKLIAEMIKDVKTGKWKIAGFRYVE